MKKVKKNSKKKKDKKSEEKKEETKLEEEVKEAEKAITHRLREALNDAEKEIEKTVEQEEFFEEPIRQFPITQTSSPVLERIIEREIPNPIIEPIQTREETNEKRIEYFPTTDTNYGFETRRENKEEKKYESSFVPPILSRREELNAIKPEFLKSQTETWVPTRGNNNEFIESEFIEEERKLPFEERKKYKRTKLR